MPFTYLRIFDQTKINLGNFAKYYWHPQLCLRGGTSRASLPKATDSLDNGGVKASLFHPYHKGSAGRPAHVGRIPCQLQREDHLHSRTMVVINQPEPVRALNVALFIAYLVNQSYKPSTVSSYASAIGYVHKLKAIPEPTSSFLILRLLCTCHKQLKSFDTCMPIVKPRLERLMLTLVHTGTDHYRQHLFQAMFALAFYAFLRIGEITITGKDRHNAHLIQKNQIRMQTKQIELKFISYKHSQGQPFSLSVMEAHALSGQCKLIYKFGPIGLAHYSSRSQAMPS